MWIFLSTIAKITLSVAYYPSVVDLWGYFSLVVLFLEDTSLPLPQRLTFEIFFLLLSFFLSDKC